LFLEKAFSNYATEMTEHAKHSKQHYQDAPSSEPVSTTPAIPKTRQKISSALQNETSESNRVQTKSSTRDGTGQMDGSGDLREASRDRNDDSDSGVQIPVKPFLPKGSAERDTRATRRTTRATWESTETNASIDNKVPQIRLEDDVVRKKWKKPLVYPWTGKKKAEVCIEDRDRLREDEFLNDNLIGFYMRFLQDHLERTNQKAAEKVYFFNSYFFDTLTNTPKGERGINYSGVEKWTRSVDLFNYDYIVVPINQAAHWYVAIICNLPSLEVGKADSMQPSSASISEKETSNQPESDVHEILESPEPEPAPVLPSREEKTRKSESPSSQDARQSFASMTIQGQEKAQREAERSEAPTESEDWPEGQENDILPPAKSSPFKETPNEPRDISHAASQAARKSKKGKAGPKLSPKQTTIVTFDSLDLGRSPTIKMLRDYICKEASSKRGVQIDPTGIKGMRARQIPLQPNFSDCGLYLLAYVEKFVQDPDSFITKLLQREMDQVDDWPPLGSGLLRHRLRKFLDDLYDEQAHVRNLSSGQAIMADQQPVSYLLGPPLPSQADPDDKGSPELPRPADAVKDKVVEEKSVVKSIISENDEQSGSLAADQPDLVPAASSTISDLSKKKKAPGPPSADANATPRLSPSKDEEVVEVPDSQEIMQAPKSPKLNCPEKKKPAKSDVPTGKKPEQKKTTILSDTAVVDLEQLSPKKPAKGSQMEVQIQVRRTPPPNSPELVRKSPRGKPRKD
jgi:sentrin-specific protease 7